MSSVPIEQERFRAYLDCPERPGSVTHLPHGDASIFVATHHPVGRVPLAYLILLPYRWRDSRRIREVATYIGRIELGTWKVTPLDRLVNLADMGRQQDLTALEIADRLIAPRPWVDDIVQRFGKSRSALKQAAKELCIPVESIRTVLRAQSSHVADAIHRRIREVTGYPWFLPTHLRDLYPNDCW